MNITSSIRIMGKIYELIGKIMGIVEKNTSQIYEHNGLTSNYSYG